MMRPLLTLLLVATVALAHAQQVGQNASAQRRAHHLR